VVGDLSEKSFEEIWNGPMMVKIREQFLRGENTMCKGQIAEAGCNKLNYDLLLESNDFSPIQKKMPIRVIPNFDGKCNLRCPTCDHPELKTNAYHSEEFQELFFQRILPGVKQLDYYSGEPFVKEFTFELMRKAADIAPQAEWSFNTNGNWKMTDSMRESLDLINIRWIAFSIDTLDANEYAQLRKYGDLDLCLRALDQLIEYRRSRMLQGKGYFDIFNNAMFHKENWRAFPDLIKFVNAKGIDITFSFLSIPDEMSVLNLSEAERIQMLEFFIDSLAAVKINYHAYAVISCVYHSLPAIERVRFSGQIQQLVRSSAPPRTAESTI